MCEGKRDEQVSAMLIAELAEQADCYSVEDQIGLPTALADSYLGDYWGLGFSDRLSY